MTRIQKSERVEKGKPECDNGRTGNHWSRWYAPITIGLIALGLYSNTVKHDFVYDDVPAIIDNPLVFTPTNLLETFQVLKEPWRPLVVFSYSITHLLFGFDSAAYHAVNIAIHTINCLLVYAIAWQIAMIWLSSNRAAIFAFAAGLIFAVHPVYSEAVSYIWGRSSSLCGTFYFSSILFVLIGYRMGSGKKQILYFSCALLTGLLAWKVKEEAITLPLLISGFFWLVGWRLAAGSTFLVPLAIMASRWSNVSMLYTNVAAQNQELQLAGATHPLESSIYSMTVIKSSVFYYLKKFLFPFNLSVDPYIRPVEGAHDEVFLMALLILMCLAAVGYLARHRLKVLSFGIITLLISPLTAYAGIAVADVVAEHRIYIAGLGFAVLTAWLVNLRPKLSYPILALLAATFFYVTFERNMVWANNISLWRDAAIKSSQLARPHLNLGVAYHSLGQYEKALEEYKNAIELNPNLSVAYSNLGIIYLMEGDLSSAELSFRRAIEVSPDRIKPYLDLATVALKQQEPAKALRVLERAQRLGDSPILYFNKAEALAALGRYSEAEKEYVRAVGYKGISQNLIQQIKKRLQHIRETRMNGK